MASRLFLEHFYIQNTHRLTLSGSVVKYLLFFQDSRFEDTVQLGP